MAFNFNDVTRKLTIVIEAGTTVAGKIKSKSYTFAGLSEEADATAVNTAATALASLMSGPVLNFYVKDTNEVLDN